MLSIGELASLGRVTIRSLRYYDEIGLLPPAEVDRSSGYRWYAPAQVPVLTRILQLRDFGLRLDDITKIVNGGLDTGGEQQLLRTARDSLSNQIEDNTLRLQRLDAYLRTTEGEVMPATIPVEVIHVAPQRVAYLTEHADGWGNRHIGPVIGPLFGKLAGVLAGDGIGDFGPAIAIYQAEESGDESGVLVTAAFALDGDLPAHSGFRTTTLPAMKTAAVATHHGEVATIDQSWHALNDWVFTNGYEMTGICREVYLSPDYVPQSEWETVLQQPVGHPDQPAPTR
jgi:DNA-binding transcriptional MerR regulator/predicted transcriptional regulator YdeE